MGLLQELAGRGKKIDEAVGDYAATPSRAIVEDPASQPEMRVETYPDLGIQGFAQKPLRGAIIRPAGEGAFKKWDPMKEVWVPVKTFYHKSIDTQYWWDDPTQKFYPFKAE